MFLNGGEKRAWCKGPHSCCMYRICGMKPTLSLHCNACVREKEEAKKAVSRLWQTLLGVPMEEGEEEEDAGRELG